MNFEKFGKDAALRIPLVGPGDIRDGVESAPARLVEIRDGIELVLTRFIETREGEEPSPDKGV